MKKLSDILYKVNLLELSGTTDIAISGICFASRKVKAGCLFVAVSGTVTDGHQFINTAIELGAVAIVFENLAELKKTEVTYIKVGDSALALAIMAENFYDNLSEKIKVVAVTGTNGKTTVAPEVEARTGLGCSTIYDGIKAGTFPAQIQLGPKAVGWVESDINAWLAARVAARDAARKASMEGGR